MVEELRRLSCENRRLTETLNHMCENYHALQKHFSQVSQLMHTNFEKEAIPSRKRKAESENYINMFGISAYTECSTGTDQEESFKRPKYNTSQKVSKVFLRTEASDTSLVSSSI